VKNIGKEKRLRNRLSLLPPNNLLRNLLLPKIL
jgi:hypothetical protein